MAAQNILKDAGKNRLCNIAQACAASLITHFGYLSTEIKTSDDETLLCFPKEVVEYFIFQKTAKQFDDADELFSGAVHKKLEQMSAQLQKFNESELGKLERKYSDADAILKSPCIVFVVDDDHAEAYNLLPAEALHSSGA